MRKNFDDLQRKIKDYLDNAFLTREELLELISEALVENIGDLNDLDTNTKDLIVNAINEIIPGNKFAGDYNEILALINQQKQALVDMLLTKGVGPREQTTINSTWDKLVGGVLKLEPYDYRDVNIYKFKVNANDVITLQNDLRGDTFSGYVVTDWGDGITDMALTHTYTTAGTYTVKTKYSLSRSTDGRINTTTSRSLVDVIDINKNKTRIIFGY